MKKKSRINTGGVANNFTNEYSNLVVHCKLDLFDIYIGRPSKWGNPFSHKQNTTAKFKTDTVEEAIKKYSEWLFVQNDLLFDIPLLKGKILGCWCAPRGGLSLNDKPYVCHGQILVELANST